MLHHVERVSVTGRVRDLPTKHSHLDSPRHQQLGDFHSESFRHVLTADVGNALESQGDMHWVPAGQVILDGLNNELDELGVARDQDRDEEVTLQSV